MFNELYMGQAVWRKRYTVKLFLRRLLVLRVRTVQEKHVNLILMRSFTGQPIFIQFDPIKIAPPLVGFVVDSPSSWKI